MLIPLGTDRPLARGTIVTYLLIGVNVAAFLLQVYGQQIEPDWWRPLERKLMVWGQEFHWWSLFSHAFLHGGLWHLLGNMVFLWVVGPNIEDRFGKVGFLVFYLAGAAAAGGLHAGFDRNPALVASSAIAACTGAYLIMFPKTTIKVFSLIFVIGVAQVPAWWFIGLSIVWDIVSQSAGSKGVAHLAHLGGYMFGTSVSFALLWAKVLPREPYDVFSMARQTYRRKQLKAAVVGLERQNTQRSAKAAAVPTGKRAIEEAARADALAVARAEISGLMGNGSIAQAAAAYKVLAERYGATEGREEKSNSSAMGGRAGGVGGEVGATVLSRRHMYELGNHYFVNGDQRAAVYVYERFLEGYPTDNEAPAVRLMLGRLNARYLNDPVRAKVLLTQALVGLKDEESRLMAVRELEALG